MTDETISAIRAFVEDGVGISAKLSEDLLDHVECLEGIKASQERVIARLKREVTGAACQMFVAAFDEVTKSTGRMVLAQGQQYVLIYQPDWERLVAARRQVP